jgi:Rrf2 family protein
MKLSTRSLYGLRLLYNLSLTYQQGPLQLSEIAQREDISEKYLSQIILLLRAAGFLASVRGNQGGYLLSRSPESITVLQVVECLEGDFLGFPDDLVDDPNAGESLRATNDLWRRLRSVVEATLGGVTLADLARVGQGREPILNFVN